jgi:alkylation response protein AidB-like acyl-CoA dehydrogenase
MSHLTSPPHTFMAAESLSSQELSALCDTVRDVVEAAGGPAVSRRLEQPIDGQDYDASTWRTLAQDIGLAGLGLPEQVGGVGGLRELLAVSEQLGAGLAAVPLLSSTVLAGQILVRCGDLAHETLAAIAEGHIATAIVADADGRFDPAGVIVATEADGAGEVILNGHASFVTDGMSAELVVVSVRTGDGVDVALVDPLGPGVTRTTMRVLDFSRPQAVFTFTAAPARLLTSDGAGLAALRGGLDVALLARAAEQLGGAQRAFDRTLDYVKIRRQFNREIGSFQAIKHRLAEALSLVELARSAVARVTWSTVDDASLAEAAAIAAAWCSEAFVAVTTEMIQLHGGIGFTWEHDAHLYFRRARADAVLWGDSSYHRERLARLRNW